MTTTPAPLRAPALGQQPHVAIIAPSWGGIGNLPERATRSMNALRALGAVPRLMPHASASGDRLRPWVSATPRERAADIHMAFADPTIEAVLCAIGGDHSAQLLPWLDMALIRASPKVLCGYSDATVLLHAIHRETGLIALYGPAFLPQFGEIGGPDDEVIAQLCKLVCGHPLGSGEVPDPAWQADEPREVTDAEGRPRTRRPAEARRVVRGGKAVGSLMPACLPSLRHLLGTPWQPRLTGALLLLEAPGPYDIRRADADLTHLKNAGLLDEIGALLLGRSEGWPAADLERLDRIALDVTAAANIPVIAGLPCSHSSPTLALPIGALAEVDGATLRLLEPVVSGSRAAI